MVSVRAVDLGRRDIALGMISLLAIVLLLPTQLLWIIVFDTQGWDRFTPAWVFMHLLPPLTVSLLPMTVGRYHLTTTKGLIAGGIVFVISSGLSWQLGSIFALCGGQGC